MSSNPYQSPEANAIGADTKTDKPASGPVGNRTMLVLRCALHFGVVTFAGPICGGAFYTFMYSDWSEQDITLRFVVSILGGVVIQIFVCFITIPIGILSILPCVALWKSEIRSLWVWGVGGVIAGAAYGLFFALFASEPIPAMLTAGAVIGAGCGTALRTVWG